MRRAWCTDGHREYDLPLVCSDETLKQPVLITLSRQYPAVSACRYRGQRPRAYLGRAASPMEDQRVDRLAAAWPLQPLSRVEGAQISASRDHLPQEALPAKAARPNFNGQRTQHWAIGQPPGSAP